MGQKQFPLHYPKDNRRKTDLEKKNASKKLIEFLQYSNLTD